MQEDDLLEVSWWDNIIGLKKQETRNKVWMDTKDPCGFYTFLENILEFVDLVMCNVEFASF
jgi:hypothetical protein